MKKLNSFNCYKTIQLYKKFTTVFLVSTNFSMLFKPWNFLTCFASFLKLFLSAIYFVYRAYSLEDYAYLK